MNHLPIDDPKHKSSLFINAACVGAWSHTKNYLQRLKETTCIIIIEDYVLKNGF